MYGVNNGNSKIVVPVKYQTTVQETCLINFLRVDFFANFISEGFLHQAVSMKNQNINSDFT
jgi:hypothetical protein